MLNPNLEPCPGRDAGPRDPHSFKVGDKPGDRPYCVFCGQLMWYPEDDKK